MKYFKINKYITLKLENKKTNIYINDKLFKQCKYLLLILPTEDTQILEEINSIDKASENLDNSLDPNVEYVEPKLKEVVKNIDPETEFWAHCSNMEAWAASDYNTQLLHSNLAFPLLKRLTEVNDLMAVKKFKEEIGRRYFTGGKGVKTYLEEEGYLDFLNKEELRSFIYNGNNVIDELEVIISKDILVRARDTIESPAIVIRNGKIIRLNLSYSNLRKLPACIQNLKSLEILYFIGNSIEEIPVWIGKLELLKQLITINNKIKSIPKSIGKLTSLKILNLSQNELETLPESMGKMLSLKKLVLYSNRLKKIPDSIGNLEALEIIFISKNLLNTLPKSIGNLSRLQSLNLGDNPIKILPSSICRLPSLRVLELRGTNIKKENNIIETLRKKKVEIYI